MNIWVNGCFDILHTGHIELLTYAKFYNPELLLFPSPVLCHNTLFVGLDSDERVKQLKGDKRPINDINTRITIMRNLRMVDKVFIFNTDDELRNLVKELNIDCIVNIPLEIEDNDFYQIRNFDKHGRTINCAIDCLNKEGLVYNFETHIPRVYSCVKLYDLFNKLPYESLSIPYALATLYFNYYTEESNPPSLRIIDYKAGFYFDPGKVASYMSNSLEEIEKAVQGKTWVNYNDMGLNLMATDRSGKQYLKEWIMKMFPNKSKYEI